MTSSGYFAQSRNGGEDGGFAAVGDLQVEGGRGEDEARSLQSCEQSRESQQNHHSRKTNAAIENGEGHSSK